MDRAVPAKTLPSGLVTFVLTDIEGSTRLFRELGEGYLSLLADHYELLRAAVAGHGGVEVGTEGDSLPVAFPDAADAVAACVEGQLALSAHRWPPGAEIQVLMGGVHTGEASPVGDNYVALPLLVARRSGGVYTALKHAVVGLVRQLAHELAPKVRVNGVAPGFMRTDIRGPKALGLGDVTPSSLPDLDEIAVATTPLRFLPRAEDYTGHFVQLASRCNAPATTGTVVACDGGSTCEESGCPRLVDTPCGGIGECTYASGIPA
jgi:Enoyl-(Acyl carrier protein) reductase/Adenylate and Guanylate cyclase catalytic domain